MLNFSRVTSGESVRNRRHRATLPGKHCVTQQPPRSHLMTFNRYTRPSEKLLARAQNGMRSFSAEETPIS
jgi:hypothetical protein